MIALVPALGASGATASPADVWTKLHRPLHVARIAAGTPCPVSRVTGNLTTIGYTGPMFGRGPAYPAGLSENGRPVLRYQDPEPPDSLWSGSDWHGNKVLWIVKLGYDAHVLLRGRQLDGPNEVRFGGSLVPNRELRIRPGGSPTTNRPSFVRVRSAGCYGIQVDGTTFSYVLVFEAKPVGA